jgi:hypothetical protein
MTFDRVKMTSIEIKIALSGVANIVRKNKMNEKRYTKNGVILQCEVKY